ncbi:MULTISPECIES: UDP-N-acetylmuramoyl-tripeptide--D-alanyl-D-alanine ligase [unclassified Streptomyces]|uniref:UDP-N-acetylmuramoyl-tripeptide--D-alanyl-D- alanine ligase n=1 Tax=unclassified Streptomyces TaxID=2593676 RepID=UPI00382191D1
MIPLNLTQIARATGGMPDQADPLAVVTAPISFDSREVHVGGLFACLPGRTTDGHDFAHQAVADGAVAVLATRPVGVPAVIVPRVFDALAAVARAIGQHYNGTVVALTGSAGKTSTKDILESVLSLDGPTVANWRSFNNEIGFPVTVSRVKRDTRYLVLEMGARGKGHIAELCSVVQPTVATVLGVGSAHVGEFGSQEAIADAKAEIIRTLPSHGVAVLNGDDPRVRAMAPQSPARCLYFGSTPDCDVEATDITMDSSGRPAFTLHYEGSQATVRLQMHGRHNVTNALAAAATALALGVPFDRTVQGLHSAQLSSGGPMEVTESGGITIINDAFNASPESVLAALTALHDIAGTDRRRIVVLGEMAELGAHAEDWHDRVADHVVTTRPAHLFGIGDTHIHRVINTARSSGIDTTHVKAADLPDILRRVLRPQDVLLVKGANALGLEATARSLAGGEADRRAPA